VVLGCDWNPGNNIIISCGEDCKYRMCDQYGRQLYCSSAYIHGITLIEWAPKEIISVLAVSRCLDSEIRAAGHSASTSL